MSKFLQLLKGAAKSNTVQINGILLAIWAAVLNSETIQANPDMVQIMAGVSALVNILLRFKTKKALADR
jgi:hypothetical protein